MVQNLATYAQLTGPVIIMLRGEVSQCFKKGYSSHSCSSLEGQRVRNPECSFFRCTGGVKAFPFFLLNFKHSHNHDLRTSFHIHWIRVILSRPSGYVGGNFDGL